MRSSLRPVGRLVLLLTLLPFMASACRAEPPAPPAGREPRKFEEAATISITVDPPVARRGQTVIWRLTMEVIPEWRTYPTEQPDRGAVSYTNSIVFADEEPDLGTPGLIPVGKLQVKEPPTPKVKTAKEDPSLTAVGAEKYSYYEGKVVFERPFVVATDAGPGKLAVKANLRLQVCKTRCIPYARKAYAVELTISDEPPVEIDPAYKEAVAAALATRSIDPPIKNDKPPPPRALDNVATDGRLDSQEELNATLKELEPFTTSGEDTGLWAFLLKGILFGAVSVITPCVFPMIPITVSFFLKQSEKEHHRPLTMALTYSGTIVVVFTLAAVFLLTTFQALSQSPWLNLFIGALFIFFALSLFGMYEIELPSGLARFTSAREGQGGLIGTVFMALTFTIVSFACVGPFLGAFAGTAVRSRPFYEIVLGGLAFSVTFASPFFLLALFPGMLKKMPKSGSWLNTVKVVMGFLVLAAGFIYLRAAESGLRYPEPASLLSYDLVLGLWVALAFLCGLYLLGLYRLPHDTPTEHLGVPRLMVSLIFLGLGVYLMPGLFQDPARGPRSAGRVYAALTALLGPDSAQGGERGLAWGRNLRLALSQARDQSAAGQPGLVFIDFTGEFCKVCKDNEANVFSKPEIQARLAKYQRVKIYTDVGDDASERYKAFQLAAFDTSALPLYVILEPLANGRVRQVAQLGGELTPKDFASFLEKPFGDQATAATARASR